MWSGNMNILLEISDSDLIFIGLAFVALILFGVVIFYIVTKGNNRTDDLHALLLHPQLKQPEILYRRIGYFFHPNIHS